VNAAATSDGDANASALCLACGLCCNGVLYKHVPMHFEHVALVRRVGLTVEADDAGAPRFPLPCPLHLDNACSVYANRPPPCESFQCALLRKFEAGDVTIEESLAIVRTARSLIGQEPSAAAQFVTRRGVLAGSWDSRQNAAAPADGARPDEEFALRAAALEVFLKKHFRLPKQSTLQDV
jgi:uncharacterized protein